MLRNLLGRPLMRGLSSLGRVAGGNAAIIWLLNDQYTTNASAPLATPRTAEPGPGVGTITDTGNLFSIASNKLTTSAAGGVTWVDPRIVYGALTRAAGIALFCTINVTGSTFANIGLYRNNSGALVNGAASITFGATLLLLDRSNGNLSIGSKTVSVDYRLCIILRSAGAYYFIKGGSEYPAWTLLFVDPIDSTATVYPTAIVQGTAGAKTFDDMRIRQLPAPFTSAYGLAAFNATSDTQSLGAELLTNADLSAWTADDPTGWTVTGETGSDPMITQVASGGGAGTGAARLYSSVSSNNPRMQQVLSATAGDIMYTSVNISNRVSGTLQIGDISTTTSYAASANAKATLIWRLVSTSYRLRLASVPGDFTIDDVSVKKMTLATARTTDADAIFNVDYTVPASPSANDKFMLAYRINASGDELNNCWLAYIQRNAANTDWDFKLDSVSAAVVTNRVSVTSIGSTDSICVIAAGNNHDCYTKSGLNWTKRGSTVSNATFATATLSNYLYAAGFTFGAFRAFNRSNAAWSAELDKVQ